MLRYMKVWLATCENSNVLVKRSNSEHKELVHELVPLSEKNIAQVLQAM